MKKYKKLDGLYNKGVYWPSEVQAVIDHVLSYSFSIALTDHAEEKIKKLNLPAGCHKSLLFGEPIEATFENGRLIKVVFRIPNTSNCFQDICGAIRFKIDDNGKTKNTAVIITIWTNSSTDNHSTLKKENYASN